jgi:hypothetical protein
MCDFVVALRATGLDDGCDTDLRGGVDAVAEGEKRIGSEHRARDLEALIGRLDSGDLRRVDATHLSRADTDGHAVPAIDDGIGLDELGHLPGELQIRELLRRGLPLRDHTQLGRRDRAYITILNQQAATDTLVVELRGAHITPFAANQNPHILLGAQAFKGLVGNRRRDDYFHELASENIGGGVRVEGSIESDDATKSRCGIGAVGAIVCGVNVLAQGHATGIGMLHDHAGGIGKGLHALQRRIGIGDVVVRHCFAVQLRGGADARLGGLAFRIEGGALMGILPVAHLRFLVELQVDGAREGATRVALVEAAEVVGDGAVVAGGVLEYLGRQVSPGGIGYGPVVAREFVRHQRIVPAVYHHRDVGVVLGGGTQHRRPTDVDVLDGGGDTAGRVRHGFLEGIQIHHQQIDGGDAMLRHDRVILSAATEQSTVDFRVQGLDTPVHDFGKAGMLRHLFDGDAGIGEQSGGAAG